MPLIEARGRRWLRPGVATALPLWIVFLASSLVPAQQPPVPIPPLAPGKTDLPPVPAPPNGPPAQPAFLVVIDPAHGGNDTGARLATNSLEKDLTLAFASRLRAALVARGVAVVVTRDSDINLSPDQRAGLANHSLASACIVLHATATGGGVHLFTSSLAPAASSPSPTPWQTAQAAWVTRSLRLSSEINSALGQAGVPTTLGVASIRPLDNLACPAVAVEIAPLATSSATQAKPIGDDKYQQRILDALVSAAMQWSADWKQQP